MTRRPRRALLLVAAIASLVVILSACGSGGAAATNSPTARPSQSDSGVRGLASVTPAAIPSEPTTATSREAHSPDPAFDYGFVVQITPGGFHPHILVASCCSPIVWINATDKPNSVVFDVEPGGSGSIPPGGSWVFTPPNAESLSYHSGTYATMTGAVQVNQISE